MNNLSTWCVMRWEGRLFVKCVRYVWGKYFGNIFFFGALAFPGCFVWGKKREDGDGWKAKCHNSLLVIASENLKPSVTNVVLSGSDRNGRL